MRGSVRAGQALQVVCAAYRGLSAPRLYLDHSSASDPDIAAMAPDGFAGPSQWRLLPGDRAGSGAGAAGAAPPLGLGLRELRLPPQRVSPSPAVRCGAAWRPALRCVPSRQASCVRGWTGCAGAMCPIPCVLRNELPCTPSSVWLHWLCEDSTCLGGKAAAPSALFCAGEQGEAGQEAARAELRRRGGAGLPRPRSVDDGLPEYRSEGARGGWAGLAARVLSCPVRALRMRCRASYLDIMIVSETSCRRCSGGRTVGAPAAPCLPPSICGKSRTPADAPGRVALRRPR